MQDKTVVVAMSGGVDSSLAAVLLREQGYNVIGITLQVWPVQAMNATEPKACCSLAAVNDARTVADRIGVPHYVLNFRDVFAAEVIDYFTAEYAAGRTPNPCVACNRRIKFGRLLLKAKELGADYLATGHYARVQRDDPTGRYLLLRAADRHKDQSYALYALTQEQLCHSLFPLGGLTKAAARRMAAEKGLSVADKPDSQEICFIPDNNYNLFLRGRIPAAIREGPIIDTAGKRLGTHRGLPFYTVGQRKGIGIAADAALYVVELRPADNTLVVGPRAEVYGRKLRAIDTNFIPFPKLGEEIRVTAKIRYNMKEATAVLRPVENNNVILSFDEPQWAITPGQTAVFYSGDSVVGGGTIEEKLDGK
ncbi:MAG: tRNA 2-thiouridine(34) synthase MnmA [bacterium]|jgi:tRNA-specific 2-thiouridylase